MRRKYGVHKMATPLENFRGSSLNLRWRKCGIWWVDQWVPVFWLHIGGFYACLDIVLWHWYDWLSWLGLRMSLFFMYYIARLVWYIDMSIIINCSSCFAWYSDSVSSWLFYSLHMHRLTIVHHLTCCVVFSGLHIILIVFWAWSLYRYLSWSS